MRFSYHTHTTFCDGKAEPAVMAHAAYCHGYTHLGFSAHAPVPMRTRWNLVWEQTAAYLATIRQLAAEYEPKGMRILAGLETDYAPGITMPDNPAYTTLGLDYTIASVHYLTTAGEEPFTVDEPQEQFTKNVRRWAGTDHDRIWRRYWEFMCAMIARGGFDIIAHFDIVKKNNADGRWFDTSSPAYLAAAQEAIDLAAQYGCVVEINTGGIARGKHHEVYPGPQLLRAMREKDIPLTIGDDAHAPSHIGLHQHAAREAARAAGYRSFWYLEKPGVWKEVSLEEMERRHRRCE
ncbi:MAG: histidinol-phosphatase [Rectinemataceae bacterium]